MDIEELRSAAGQRYDIEGFLVEGGMGAIYTARHRSLGSRVAIKVLPPEVASSAVRLARFKREAALAANLSHPNIVPVYEFDATPQLAYLVMPYVEGDSFADQLAKEGKLDYSKVRRMLGQVAKALGFAHARDVVHRDIKPANILREEAAGRWLITDFGIAHVTGTTGTEITQTGTVIGTPAYMSPEQRWGGKVDARSDLFSLAAVAYQAICGTPTEQLPDELLKERTELERAIRGAQPKIKPEVARVLAWPLEIAKEDRPESAEAWLEALEQAEGTSVRVRWAWAAGAAAVVIAGLVFLLRERPPPEELAVPTLAVFPFSGGVSGEASYLKNEVSQAFDFKLQGLGPHYLVIGPTELQQEINRRHGSEVPNPRQLIDIARDLNVTTALSGRTQLLGDSLTVALRLWQVASGEVLTEFSETSPTGSFHALIDGMVEKIVTSLAVEITGWPDAIPQGGFEAYRTYFRADRDLREGRYQTAVRRFNEVISYDTTFAPAYFKRMLAQVFAGRPSQYSTWLRPALEAATRYRDELDTWSQRMLDAYRILLVEGDIRRADSIAQDLVERNPQAETYFLLGYVQFSFGPVLPNAPRGQARQWFLRAQQRDPKFAMALWHLVTIGMLEDDGSAQMYFDDLLAVDSVSFWAEVVIMADSVLSDGFPNLAESIDRLSDGALEIVSQTLGELDPPRNSDPVAREALRVLWNRAQDPADKRLPFRMRMADRLARARFPGADSLSQEGIRAQVPSDELARWLVLSAITPLPKLGGEPELNDAVRRLQTGSASDAEAAWLLARWHMEQGSPMADHAIQNLNQIADDPALTSPQARSLMKDVEAVRSLASGDTAKALDRWSEATRYYSVDEFKFGLTASLWPLRLKHAQVLVQQKRYEAALEVMDTFRHMFGFIDQVAWPEVLLLDMEAASAIGETARASEAFRLLDRLLDRDSNAARDFRARGEAILNPT